MNTTQTSVEVQQTIKQGWEQVNKTNAQPRPLSNDSILSSARSARRMGHSMWGKK